MRLQTFYEDIEVGDKLPTLQKGPISYEQLIKYAGASEDYTALHLDNEFGKAAGFGGIIVHGMLSMAFVGEMISNCIGYDGRILKYGVRFKAIVKPTEVLNCEGEVIEKLPDNCVICKVAAVKQNGQQAVEGNATVRLPSKD